MVRGTREKPDPPFPPGWSKDGWRVWGRTLDVGGLWCYGDHVDLEYNQETGRWHIWLWNPERKTYEEFASSNPDVVLAEFVQWRLLNPE